MVTASCRTAAIAFVIYDISPRNQFVPMLYIIVIPMPIMNTTDSIQESISSAITTIARIVAMATYTGSWASASSLRSVTKALIPLRKQCLPPSFLIS